MASYAEYFSKNRSKPLWHIGDRVSGKWNNIPFVGTVYVDHLVNEEEGPVVIVHLDLPILYKKTIYNQIKVKQKSLNKLK